MSSLRWTIISLSNSCCQCLWIREILCAFFCFLMKWMFTVIFILAYASYICNLVLCFCYDRRVTALYSLRNGLNWKAMAGVMMQWLAIWLSQKNSLVSDLSALIKVTIVVLFAFWLLFSRCNCLFYLFLIICRGIIVWNLILCQCPIRHRHHASKHWYVTETISY